ncbi:hypothetical protein L3X38_020768 [Prunus dulcis]|uniref:Integrase catalytic domain-containing protein n=1 Tax=Prunus dulcis TaxID=3755 RepID=A0AAD4WF31_PRUDU|nr:hypothetical protein L3X38_020768 [Prunus dulcis]
MTWVSHLKTKGEVSSRFQQFYQMVETQFHARIQVLRSDNGGEFLNHDLNQFLQGHGIIHQGSCLYTPQQKGDVTLHRSDLLPVESNQSPLLSSLTTETLLKNDQSPVDRDRSPEENDPLSPCCQNQEEEIEPFYEILPTSAPVPH